MNSRRSHIADSTGISTSTPDDNKHFRSSAERNGGKREDFDEHLLNPSEDVPYYRTRHMTFSGVSLKTKTPEDEDVESKSPRRHTDDMSPSRPVSKKTARPVFSFDKADIQRAKRSKSFPWICFLCCGKDFI